MSEGVAKDEARDRADETALIRAVVRGDQVAAARLVSENERSLWLLLWRLTGSRAAAEDHFQEVWARALRALPRFSGGSRFSTWLYRIAMNVIHDDAFRASKRGAGPLGERDVVDNTDGPSDGLARIEEQDRALRMLAHLSGRQREAVVLHHLQGRRFAEVAEILGITEATARHYAHEGLKKVRNLFEQPETAGGRS